MTLPSDPAQRAKEIAPPHYSCDEDGWYSCPLSEEGCLNDAQAKVCTCGREDLVKRITDALTAFAAQQVAQARRETWEEAATLAASRHFSQARDGIDNRGLWELEGEFRRRAGGQE